MAQSAQQRILAHLTEQAETLPPGTRLPTVRQLMTEYKVSQSVVERALDELSRLGLVRRERSRGIFVDGFVPETRMLGICCNDQTNRRTNQLFCAGVREAAAENDFQVADFGPRPIRVICETLLGSLTEMGFAGLVLDLSTAASMHLEADDSLAEMLRAQPIPLVVTHPLPAIEADCVSTDDFETFRRIGEALCQEGRSRVLFLGHRGLPTLARYYGLEAGLAGRRELLMHIADPFAGGAMEQIPHIRDSAAADGCLVVGAPPTDDRSLAPLLGGPWQAGTDRSLVVTLEEGDVVPDGLRAHVVTKPARAQGAAAADLLIRRLQRPRAVRRHKVVPYQVRMHTN